MQAKAQASATIMGLTGSRPASNPQEHTMAKGQQSQKMVKKPKKDTSPPKPVSPDAVRPTIVTVVPVRGKLKNK
jgi:hypothetical protein